MQRPKLVPLSPPEQASRYPLPAQPTPLIGREQEVEAVRYLLCRPDVHLVTLTGTPGIGKTRLALQAAAELLVDFADGVYFVPLAPITDPHFVIPAIAHGLGLTKIGSQPLFDQLKAYLQDRSLLLLLDNFEQVVSAATLLAELLEGCPQVKLLVTSREVLHLRAEHQYPVPPLALPDLKRLPDPGSLSLYAAVALLMQRAQAVKPDFQITRTNARIIAEMCTRLDGLPLAIELAAARIKVLSPQALLARLERRLQVLTGGARDLPERQQTLRGTIQWSYNLLSAQEQQLFRRLAIFVDGCTLEAAEAVYSAGGTLQGDILEGLASLVDKSLLRQEEQAEGEARFGMLQVLREFGLETLASAGELEATRQAHALYYLRFSEQAEPHLKGAEQVKWFERLEQEHENLRAALTFLLERAGVQQGTEQAEQALRLGAALERFWVIRRFQREGWTFLEQALASRTGVAAPVRVKALLAAAVLAFNLEQAEALSRESLALSRELGDRHSMAVSLFELGTVAWERSQYAMARARLEEAAALFQEVGDTWKRGQCLTQLARIFSAQGEYTRTCLLLEESLGLYRALGDQERIGWVLGLLARVYFRSHSDLEKAAALAEESLALLREVGYTYGIAYTLYFLGRILLAQGEIDQTSAVFEESASGLKEMWARTGDIEALSMLAHVVALQGDLEQARALYLECLALERQAGFKGLVSACLEGLAAVLAGQGAPVEAARLLGAAEALGEAIGMPLDPFFRTEYEQVVSAARAQLGEEAFARIWAEGRMMTPEQVLASQEPTPMSEPLPSAPPPQAAVEPAPTYPNELTEREVEVLRLVAQGLTNAQIAERLVVSPHTIHAHTRSIHSKLGVTSRSAATRFAFEHKLV